jgi:uncharacterized protein (TIGR03118 family)
MADSGVTTTTGVVIAILSIAVVALFVLEVAGPGPVSGSSCTIASGCEPQPTLLEFQQVNLTSSVPGVAAHTDAKLIDAWGLEFGDPGRIWVNAQSGYSEVYNATGAPVMIDDSVTDPGTLVPLSVYVPPDPSAGGPAPLTGLVFDALHGQPGAPFDGDAFTFVSEQGVIAGWGPLPSGLEPLNATIRVDNYAAGAVYKGVTSAPTPDGWELFVANFGEGRVDVFNSTYQPVETLGGFVDPSLPAGYAPFDIQYLEGHLFVTYAKQSIDDQNDVKGLGNGYIDIYDLNGSFVQRLVSRGQLNSPWGLALTPSDYGSLSDTLLVGNFGDGHINAYNVSTGAYVGTVAEGGSVLQIDDLWSLTFGTGNGAGATDQLYFTAGSSAESQGIFGELDLPGVN